MQLVNKPETKRYDRLSRDIPHLPGERVLLRNFRRRAHGKLAPRWIPTPFVVVSQLKPNQPVYIVKPEGKGGPIKTLHHNNIRPCGLLLQPDAVTQDPEQPQPTPQSPAPAPGFPLNPRPVTLGQPTWFGLLPGPATTLRGQRHTSCGPRVTGIHPPPPTHTVPGLLKGTPLARTSWALALILTMRWVPQLTLTEWNHSIETT